MRIVFDNRIARFVVLFVLTICAYAGAQFVQVWAVPHVPAESRENAAIAAEIVCATLLLLIYWASVRLLEHRRIGELAPQRAPANLLAGAAIGLGLFSAVIAALSAIGIAHVGHFNSGQSLLGATDMAILSGIGEELIFRGVVYRIFEEMFGSLVALIVSAAFFGATHLANPGATLTSGAAIALEAGVLLGVSYMMVRNLWLPIGLHFGWNFAESAIFGSVVSGNAFKGLFATTMTGPELLTGGKFGPEASVVAVAICAAAAAVILVVAVRRGEWKTLHLAINDKTRPLAPA
jgi:membrane protease YdiL (CAAX protease family)